ncbi:histone-fold-containing protein, partial [Aureobasidium melanogenum]
RPRNTKNDVASDANIRNFAPVARIMKGALPDNAKIAKEAKECMQECVSEFISFITSEASEKCQQEKRKTVNGEDILFAMTSLGFENYAEALKIYLARYRETLVARGEHQRPMTSGGTTLNSAGGPQETSPFEGSNNGGAVLGNAMEPTEGSGNDYTYGVGQGATGEY